MNNLFDSGTYKGAISTTWDNNELRVELAAIKTLVSNPNNLPLSHNKDFVVKANIQIYGKPTAIAIKVFGPQQVIKDWYDKKNKSKAQRSFEAAQFLEQKKIGTPSPIAYLNKWERGRLTESYYLCFYEPGICFRDALFHVYHQTHSSTELMALLHVVAPAIRKMHDAGFMHGDMGNQNILLPKNQDGSWADPIFIDLNRCEISSTELPVKQRAFDLSRPLLPGNFLKFFLHIYHQHQLPSAEFEKWHNKYRNQFEKHRKSRKLRHPIRSILQYLNSKENNTDLQYPNSKDYWLWDEKTEQPMIALSKKEKHRERFLLDFLFIIARTLYSLPKVISHYRKLENMDFANPVNLSHKIGIAINPKSEYISRQMMLLKRLGNPPILIRFCRHESPQIWSHTIQLIHALHQQGFKIMVALLQDRIATKNSAAWNEFLETVIPKIANHVDTIEITHAYNRIKWGVWSLKELSQLFAVAFEFKKRFPQLQLTGPACIDFEYAPVISAFETLRRINPQYQFNALSHLLYVDRRGAPENKQGKFSTLEKSRMLRAIAKSSRSCQNRVIISEVNWPLNKTGIWSPVVCPYLTPHWQQRPSGETPEIYAHFMLRYLAITICSGYVDQVFWWQLCAHGYGLIDDQDNFRERPAFTALEFFLQLLGNARFEKKLASAKDTYLLEFSLGDRRYLMVWTTSQLKRSTNVKFEKAWDYLGNPIDSAELSGAPVYLLVNNSPETFVINPN